MQPTAMTTDPPYNGTGPNGSKMNLKKSQDLVKAHMQQKVMVIDDVDRQVWELISNVPSVGKPVAVVQALFNFILPGTGTWITACAANENVSKTQLTIGMFQLLTSFILVGKYYTAYPSFLFLR